MLHVVPLLAVTLAGNTLITLICGGVAAFAVAKLAFKEKTHFEDDAMALIDNAYKLQENGLSITPDFMKRIAIGDISRAVKDFKTVFRFLKGNPKMLQAEFDGVLEKIVDKRITEPAVQDYLKKALNAVGVTSTAAATNVSSDTSGSSAPVSKV